MKVPTYRRTLGLPKAAPGQDLSALASPGKVAMAAEAYGALGGTIQTEGLRWFGHQLKTERATEQATKENEFEAHVQQGFTNIESTTPEDFPPVGSPLGTTKGSRDAHMSATNRQRNHVMGLRDQAQRQAMTITDPVVRRRFLTSANKRIASVTPQVNSKIQAQFKDYSQATFAKRRVQVLNAIILTPQGDVRDLMVEDFIGSIAEQGRQNFWTEKETVAAMIKAASDIDLTQARRDLADAKTEEGKLTVLKRLDTGVYEATHEVESMQGQPAYPNLDLKDRGLLAGRAIRQADSAAAAAVRLAATQARALDKEATDARETFEQNIAEGIDAYRVAGMTGESDAAGKYFDDQGNEIKQWSVEEILALSDRKIDHDARNRLVARIQGSDGIYNDAAHLELSDAIYDAFTERELDDVEQRIRQWHNGNIIGFKSRDRLVTQLGSARKKTPGFQEAKDYRGYLNALMARTGIEAISAIFKGTTEGEDPKIPASGAQRFFDERLRLGDRPAEAFHKAASAFVSFDKRSDVAASFLITMPPSLQEILNFDPNKPEVDYSIDLLTTDHTARAWDEWERLSEGSTGEMPGALDLEKTKDVRREGQLTEEEVRGLDLTERQRITFRSLYAAENALEMITGWVTTPGTGNNAGSDTTENTESNNTSANRGVVPGDGNNNADLEAVLNNPPTDPEDDSSWKALLEKIIGSGKDFLRPSTIRDFPQIVE